MGELSEGGGHGRVRCGRNVVGGGGGGRPGGGGSLVGRGGYGRVRGARVRGVVGECLNGGGHHPPLYQLPKHRSWPVYQRFHFPCG